MVGHMSFRLIWYQLIERRASHEYLRDTLGQPQNTGKSRSSQPTIITPVTLCLLLFFHSRPLENCPPHRPTQSYPLYHIPSQPTETSVASSFRKGNFILLTERKKEPATPPSSPLLVLRFPPASKTTPPFFPCLLLHLTTTRIVGKKGI